MKSFDLSEVRHSLYFWPAVTLSGIAVFFFAWAGLILERDWLGQAIWGAVAALMAMVLLVTAMRASHRTATTGPRFLIVRPAHIPGSGPIQPP